MSPQRTRPMWSSVLLLTGLVSAPSRLAPAAAPEADFDLDPVSSLLRQLDKGETLAAALPTAARGCDEADATCARRLRRVLRTLAKEPDGQAAVTAAFATLRASGIAESQVIRFSPSPGSDLTADRDDEELAPTYRRLAEGHGPPTRSDRHHLRSDVFDARLGAYVDSLLGDSAEARVRVTFEAAVAESCAEVLGGGAQVSCAELGLWEIQRIALHLGLAQLDTSSGLPEVVSRYLDLSPELLEKVIDVGSRTSDEFISTRTHLLRRWLRARPSRFETWAQIEEALNAVPTLKLVRTE